jgi:hypothetical protein
MSRAQPSQTSTFADGRNPPHSPAEAMRIDLPAPATSRQGVISAASHDWVTIASGRLRTWRYRQSAVVLNQFGHDLARFPALRRRADLAALSGFGGDRALLQFVAQRLPVDPTADPVAASVELVEGRCAWLVKRGHGPGRFACLGRFLSLDGYEPDRNAGQPQRAEPIRRILTPSNAIVASRSIRNVIG